MRKNENRYSGHHRHQLKHVQCWTKSCPLKLKLAICINCLPLTLAVSLVRLVGDLPIAVRFVTATRISVLFYWQTERPRFIPKRHSKQKKAVMLILSVSYSLPGTKVKVIGTATLYCKPYRHEAERASMLTILVSSECESKALFVVATTCRIWANLLWLKGPSFVPQLSWLNG